MTDDNSVSHLPKWLIPVTAISALILVILFALGVLGGDKKTEPGNTEIKGQALPNGAKTLKIAKQAETNVMSWQGTVRSRLAVKIAPKLNARIVEVLVHPGDRLKKGDVIARLDDRDLRAAYNAANAAHIAAQAQAGQARSEEKRIIELYNKQAATRQNYDAVLAQAQSAQAMANQAASTAQQSKVMLGENVLYAPFDGVVGERLQEPGDMGMPGLPIITFLKPDDLRLEVAIADRCSAQIKLGMTVTVRIDVIQQRLTGTVDEITPEIDPQTRSQQIKVRLPKVNGLQHGQFAWLELGCQAEQPALLVPATSIVHYGQLQAVKVAEGQWLHVRHIRTGKEFGDQVQVLSGLHEGDTILVRRRVATMRQVESKKDSLTVSIVRLFTTSHLSLLFLLISLVAGAMALMLTPREEDPQIIVPVMDVFVQVPGASSEEVEKQVTTPLEVLLRQIKGVEYVYSASRPGEAVVTVRFFVGENLENSLIKTRDKLLANQDIIPPGVSDWLVKPVEIDDVPILLLSLSPQNAGIDAMALRRIADELIERLRSVDNVGKSWVIGATPRRISVYPAPSKLEAGGVSILEVKQALAQNNINLQVGHLTENDREILLEAGPHYQNAEQVGATVLKSIDGRLLYLRDVAEVLDGAADTDEYTRIGFGPAVAQMKTVGENSGQLPEAGQERQMVTIAIGKRQGSNAVSVAEQVLALTGQLKGTLIPDDVLLTVTRNYGETADHKVNELVMHLSIAILTIIVLLAFTLGLKESLIVSLAVPMTFAITLLFDLIFGYTINRVTLFALILSLGLLVDDPIVDVENIHRHYKMRKEPPLQALLSAVNEIRPPTILATFAVIMSFVPMFFITGMMGPYMAPMAFNVPIAMLLSLIIAFTVTPWASYRLLKGDYGKEHGPAFDLKDTRGFKIYQSILGPLLDSKSRARWFLLAVFIAFVVSAMMAVTRIVPLKLLPFDNKNELQLIIDMPKGSSLEATDQVAAALGNYLATVNEVSSYQSYVGIASPMDFNGMVRHYYLRQGAHLGDIRIVLADKTHRQQSSHDIALRIRPEIDKIKQRYGANIKIVEMPPGPPVLSTLVAEVYGPPEAGYSESSGCKPG